MKKVLLTMALCVAATAAYAQKSAVNQAQSIAKSQNADYAEARSLIKGALENAETKGDAKTWVVAGSPDTARRSWKPCCSPSDRSSKRHR